MRWSLALVFVLGFCVSPSLAQQSSIDPAKLLPVNTLAFAELHTFGPLTKEVRQLIAKSVLGNVPESIAKLRKKYPTVRSYSLTEYSMFGMFFTPEMEKEVSRFQSVAVGFTGLEINPATNIPDFLVILQPGESALPGLYTRAFTAAMSAEVTQRIGKTAIYRFRNDGGFGPLKKVANKERYVGPAVALLPGLILIGSDKLVTNAVVRIHGKGPKKGESTLAQSAAFRVVRERMGGPGTAFGFANARAALKLKQLPFFGPLDNVLNLKSIQGFAASARLKNGNLSVKKELLVAPGQKSPLIDLLPKQKVDKDLLRYVPGDISFATLISNENGLARWTQAIRLADKLMKQITPEGQPLETMVKNTPLLSTAKAVFVNVDQAAFAIGNPLTSKIQRVTMMGRAADTITTTPLVPLYLVVKANDVATAKILTQKIPGFMAQFQVKAPKAKAAKVQGQTVYTIQNNIGQKLSYGRIGQYLILGLKGNDVASAMVANQTKKHVLANKATAASIQKLDPSGMFVMIKPVTAFMGMPSSRRKYTYRVEKRPGKGNEDDDKNKVITEVKPNPQLGLYKSFLKNEAWSFVTVTQTKNAVRFVGAVNDLPRVVPGVVDWTIESQVSELEKRELKRKN